ncbi:MAG: hypothetical protein IKH34_10260 [Oscillospiraceae bacterium]|nr:hypothetical protein [Oscillospiraceae bacterium]
MKKRLLSILLAAIMLLSVLPAAAADTLFSTEEQLLELFDQQKAAQAEEFEFTCEQDLFARLMEDNGRLLHVLLRKGGIASARVQYGEESCLVKLSETQYTDAPWAECATEEEACLAIRRLLRDGNESFALLCAPELAKALAETGDLRSYAAQAGVEGLSLTYYTNGIIQVQDPVPFAAPWAPVENTAQFDAAVESFALLEADEFYIIFSPALFETLLEDEEQRTILHASSMLDRFTYTSEALYGVLHYTRASYLTYPSLVCRSLEELQEAISHLGARETPSFRFYLADQGLRDLLMDTPLGYLHHDEAEAGLTYEVQISHNSNYVFYTNAKYIRHAELLGSAEEAEDYLAAQARAGAEQASLYCTPELYTELAGEEGSYPGDPNCLDGIYAMIDRAGVSDYDVSINRSSGAIRVQIHGCYPAVEILRAVDTETVRELPSQQQDCLAAALDLAEHCRNEDPMETLESIRQALAEIELLPEGGDAEADSAVGALLQKKASLRGLADAFYLVGSLAGLELRYPSLPAAYQPGEGENETGLLLPPGLWLRADEAWVFVTLDLSEGTEA